MALSDRILEQTEQRRRFLARMNRVLILFLPLVTVALGAEAAHWVSEERASPRAPLAPDLRRLQEAPVQVPELPFSPEVFPSKAARREPASASAGPTQVAVKEISWKLLGVVMTPVRRAYLEDSENHQTVTVGEGEKVGDILVKRTEERSVLLEREGSSYEIRL